MQNIHTHFDNRSVHSRHRRIVMAAGLGMFVIGGLPDGIPARKWGQGARCCPHPGSYTNRTREAG